MTARKRLTGARQHRHAHPQCLAGCQASVVGKRIESQIDAVVLRQQSRVGRPPQTLDPPWVDLSVRKFPANPLAIDRSLIDLYFNTKRDWGTWSRTLAQTSIVWGVIFARLLKLPNVTYPRSKAGRVATAGA